MKRIKDANDMVKLAAQNTNQMMGHFEEILMKRLTESELNELKKIRINVDNLENKMIVYKSMVEHKLRQKPMSIQEIIAESESEIDH